MLGLLNFLDFEFFGIFVLCLEESWFLVVLMGERLRGGRNSIVFYIFITS